MDEQMKAPVISTKTDLSLVDAKNEYRELKSHLKNCPRFGWVKGIKTQIDDRIDFLKTLITDHICFTEKKNERRKRTE